MIIFVDYDDQTINSKLSSGIIRSNSSYHRRVHGLISIRIDRVENTKSRTQKKRNFISTSHLQTLHYSRYAVSGTSSPLSQNLVLALPKLSHSLASSGLVTFIIPWSFVGSIPAAEINADAGSL
jgi:hypothetical protein